MSNADRKVFYKATLVKLANILLDQTNFPEKPLRKSHLTDLSSAYFTKLVGLTNPLTTTKNTDVFELYLSKRTLTMIDPVISIFGK